MNGDWVTRISTSKSAAIAILLLFLSTRIVLLELYQPPGTDITVYHEYVTRAAQGQVPYRDIAIEYPPLAWSAMTLPASTDWSVYRQRFRYTMFAAETAACALLTAVLRMRRRDLTAFGLITYVAATTALGPVLYDRLDAGLLFLLMLWACAWQRGMSGASSWMVLSYAALGLGVAFKLTPIVALPVLLAFELTTGWDAGRVAKRMGALAAGTLLPFLAHFSGSGASPLSFLMYHGARGIEVGSFFANLLWVLSFAGLPIAVDYRFTSFEMTSGLSGSLGILSTVCLIALPIWLAVHARLMGPLYDGQAAFRYACLVVPAMLLFGKVLSPQYFVWAIPMMLLVSAEVAPSRRTFGTLCALMIVVAILTTGVYPFGFAALRALRTDAWLLLTARNALLAAVVVWMSTRTLNRS